MSPRHQKDHKDIHDSTTEFFFESCSKRKKEKTSRENSPTKENINTTKTKTIDTVGRFYNYINKTLDKILSSKNEYYGFIFHYGWCFILEYCRK